MFHSVSSPWRSNIAFEVAYCNQLNALEGEFLSTPCTLTLLDILQVSLGPLGSWSQ